MKTVHATTYELLRGFLTRAASAADKVASHSVAPSIGDSACAAHLNSNMKLGASR